MVTTNPSITSTMSFSERSPTTVKRVEIERLSKQKRHQFLDGEFNVVPILSGFGEGQGHMGVVNAPYEIFNAGFSELCDSVDWNCLEPEMPLLDFEVEPVEDSAKISERYGVKNIDLVGKKLHEIYKSVKKTADAGKFAVNIGGDHSVAGASIAAMMEKYPDLRVVWVDAHADCNTPASSPSHNYHGMVLGHLMGWFSEKLPYFEWMRNKIPENRVAYFGLRDIDNFERQKLKTSGMMNFSMKVLDGGNIIDHVREALKKIDPDNQHPIHISFDVDAADPLVAPGTGTKCEGGLSYRECIRIVEEIQSTGRLVSMDIVEVNIEQDTEEEPLHGDDPAIDSSYRTVKFALHLVRAALGYLSC